MIVKLLLPIFLVLGFLGCKKTVSERPIETIVRNIPSAKEPSLEEKALAAELQDLKAALSTYKKAVADAEQSAKEQSEDFDKMLELVEQLDEKEIAFLASKKEFSETKKRIDIVSERLLAEDAANDEKREAEAKRDEMKQVKKAGVYMVALGVIGSFGGYTMGRYLNDRYQSLKDFTNKTSKKAVAELPDEVKKGIDQRATIASRFTNKPFNAAHMTKFALAGVPLSFVLLGATLLASEEPSSGLIDANKTVLFVTGGAAITGGLTLAAVAASPRASGQLRDFVIDSATKTLDYFDKNTRDLPRSSDPRFSADIKAGSQDLVSRFRGNIVTYGVGAALLGGVGVLFASELALTQQLSAKEVLLAKVTRFWDRVVMIEADMEKRQSPAQVQ